MKILFDFLPIILFFATYKFKGIYAATTVAIVASVIMFAWIYLKGRKPNIMQWLSVGTIIIFGGATIYFENATFIKLKPSILYSLMGSALLIAHYGFKRNLLKLLMGEQITLPSLVWTKLNWMWATFFIFMAGANLFVAYRFSQDFWVNFKLFGSIGFMIVFVIAQSLYLSRYIQEETPTVPSSNESSKES